MTLRVVHCGTGSVGTSGLQGIINHPDLELVGQFVWSSEKVGVDSGILCGLPETGIRATDDWDALLDLAPDCLSYFGDSVGRELQAVDDVCRFLERGTNAVTISVYPWGFPPGMPPEYGEPAVAACAKGNSTAFFSGIDPGWATTDLAIAALACADRVDCVRVQELGWWGDYTAEFVCREYFGFGQSAGFEPILISGGFLKTMWAPTLLHIADVLGVEVEDWNVVYETDSVDHDVQAGFGTVAAGTTSVVHFELQALNGGRPIAIVEHADRIAGGAGPQWPEPFGPEELSFRIEVEGDPTFTLELNFDGSSGYKMTAMPAINAIPAVCAAQPGVKGPLEIPRYFARNVAARVTVGEPRRVVVTGASRGLGAATAAHLYRRGWHVVAAMRDPHGGMERLRAAVAAPRDDPRLAGVRLDLADPDVIAEAAAEILRTGGAPQGLVHNAGISIAGCVEEVPVEVWEDLFATNLFGPVRLTQALLPAMRAAGRGRIVMITSLGGVRGMAEISAYAAAKGGAERWAQSLGDEVAAFGLGVTVLVPGAFRTDIIDQTGTYADEAGPYAEHHRPLQAAGLRLVGNARPAEEFAPAVERALLDRSPYVRRAVGRDAQAMVLASRLLPDRVLRMLLERAMGMPRPGSLADDPVRVAPLSPAFHILGNNTSDGT